MTLQSCRNSRVTLAAGSSANTVSIFTARLGGDSLIRSYDGRYATSGPRVHRRAALGGNGFFRIADNSFGAFLNGVYIPGRIIGTDTWGFDNALTANAGFVNGINTLELCGESYNSNWDGFYVEAVVQGVNNVVPEPSTYALMGLGLSIVGLIARRRRGVSRAA